MWPSCGPAGDAQPHVWAPLLCVGGTATTHPIVMLTQSSTEELEPQVALEPQGEIVWLLCRKSQLFLETWQRFGSPASSVKAVH